MFGLDAFHLARIQFAFTVSFHIIFPAITIGLASYLVVLEGLWLKKRSAVYLDLYHFWSKVFAVNFGMGVVSGLVMAYQFGTNWSGFSQFAGSITGPLLTYEVLTAFFLEAGFLGVMLFGRDKVGPGLHFFATSRFPGRYAVWSRQSRTRPAFLCYLHGGSRNININLLDPGFQQLDAHASGIQYREWCSRASGLDKNCFQPIIPMAFGAYDDSRFPCKCVLRWGIWRMASA